MGGQDYHAKTAHIQGFTDVLLLFENYTEEEEVKH